MLPQLVEQDQITAEAAAALAGRRRHPVLTPGNQFHVLRVSQIHLLDQLGEILAALRPFDGFEPRLLRVGEILRGADHGFVVSVDTPQFFPSSIGTIALLETLLSFVVAVASEEIVERVETFHKRRHQLGMYYAEDK